MSEIALTDYYQQIDRLIAESRLVEATAHCRHILSEHPRHIPAYRLLGKALLEQQKLAAAREMFQRVLSADPEDFVSHIGLSITFKEDQHLEPAIWHMERAYEMDPYNAGIQEELRSLYARRHGAEPERLALTAGALARLHARCELFPQAIAACRQILAEDPARVDIQVLLAEALWRSDRRIDAVEVCQELLDALPNCIKALAILAEVWLLSGRAAEARGYLQHIQRMLAPDEAHLELESAVGIAFRTDGAPALPDSVRIAQLEGDAMPAAVVGTDAAPDWVAELNRAQDPDAVPDDESWFDEAPDIDWFRGGDESSPQGAEGDVPDWLSQISAEVGTEPFASSARATDGLDATQKSGLLAAASAAADREAVDDVADDAVEAPVEDVEVLAEMTEVAADLEWLTGELGDEPAAPADFASWLDDALGPEDGGVIPEEFVAPEAAAPTDEAPTELENLPDWLEDAGDIPPAARSATDLMTALAGVAGREPEGDEAPEATDSAWPNADNAIADAPGASSADDGEADSGAAGSSPSSDAQEPGDGPIFAGNDWVRGDLPEWLDEPDAEVELQLAVTDWLQEMKPDVWESSDEPLADFEADDLSPAPGISLGNLPGWLQEQAPRSHGPNGTGTLAAHLDETLGGVTWIGDELPDMHDELGFLEEADDDAVFPAPPADAVEPDEVQSARLEAAAPVTQTEREPGAENIKDEIMDRPDDADPTPVQWPQDEDEPMATTGDEEAVGSPDWLQLDPESLDEEDELPDWLQLTDSDSFMLDELPDWRDVDAAADEAPADASAPDDDWPQDDAESHGGHADLSWLDEIAAGAGSPLEELPTLRWPTEAPAEAFEALSEAALPVPDEASMEDMPDALPDMAATGADVQDLDEDMMASIPDDPEEAMAWLERLAARQGAPLDELPSLSSQDVGETSMADAEPETASTATDDPVVEAWSGAGEAMLEDEATPEVGEMPSLDVEDALLADIPDEPEAAMAWLEQLAARQGAPLEELPTLSAANALDDAAMDEDEEVVADADRLPMETTGIADDLADMIPEDPEEAMAWLEKLAARQGASLDELPSLQAEAASPEREAELAETLADEPMSTVDGPERPVSDAPADVVELLDEAVELTTGSAEADAEPTVMGSSAAEAGAIGVGESPAEEPVAETPAPSEPEPVAEATSVADDETPVVEAEAQDAPASNDLAAAELAAWLGAPDQEADELSLDTLSAAMPDEPEAAMAWLQQLADNPDALWSDLFADTTSAPEEEETLPDLEAIEGASGFPDAEADSTTMGEAAPAEDDGQRPGASAAESTFAVPDVTELDLVDDVPADPDAALDWLVDWAQIDDDELAAPPLPDWTAGPDAAAMAAALDEADSAVEPPAWDWLTGAESPATDEAPAAAVDTDETVPAVEPDVAVVDDLVAEVEEALPDWLSPAEPDDDEWLGALAEPEVDLEDWLSVQEAVSREAAGQPTAADEEAIELEPTEMPDWLAEMAGLEEDVPAQPVEKAAPTAESPAVDAGIPEVEAMSPAEAEVPSGMAEIAEEEPPVPVEEPPPAADEPALAEARAALAAGQMEAAVRAYGRLIRAGVAVEAVVADLEKATVDHQRQPLLVRLLGDAYAQQGDLQRAIDIYRRVMDHL